MNLENPRKLGQEAVKASVSKEVWEENRAFVDRLKKEIAAHTVTRHEAIEELSGGAFNK